MANVKNFEIYNSIGEPVIILNKSGRSEILIDVLNTNIINKMSYDDVVDMITFLKETIKRPLE